MNRLYVAVRVAAFELGAQVRLNLVHGNLTCRDGELWADLFEFKPDEFHCRHMFLAGFASCTFGPADMRRQARKAIDDLHDRLSAARVPYVGRPPRRV